MTTVRDASFIGESSSHDRIVRTLGVGAMGVSLAPEDLSLCRHLAVKVLPDKLLNDANARKRFQREARAASSLDHPNIYPRGGRLARRCS